MLGFRADSVSRNFAPRENPVHVVAVLLDTNAPVEVQRVVAVEAVIGALRRQGDKKSDQLQQVEDCVDSLSAMDGDGWLEGDIVQDFTGERRLDILEFDWDAHGAHLVHAIAACVEDEPVLRASAANGFQSTEFRGTRRRPGILARFTRSAERIAFEPSPDGRRVTVSILSNARIEEEALAGWRNVLAMALGYLHRELVSRAWTGIIGEIDGLEEHQLAESASLAQYDLRPVESRIFHREPQPGHLLNSTGRLHFFRPIAISAKSVALSTVEVEEIAAREMRLICALLSLSWGSTWLALSSPGRATPQGELPSCTGSSAPPSDQLMESMRDTSADDVHITGDIVEAMLGLGDHPETAVALLMYHEALLLQHDHHQSMALVALTAAIESVAQFTDPQIELCLVCNQVTGSTRRFNDAIRAYLPEQDRKKLLESYDMRSQAVHTARLLGLDPLQVAGEIPMYDLHSAEPAAYMSWRLWTLTGICRSLLCEKLGVTSAGGLRSRV